MAEVKFEETRIPEDVSREMAESQLVLGAAHVGKILKVMVTGVSKLLGDVKDLKVPKSVKFTRPDGGFIAGARVEYHTNPDDPENPSAGNWSYVWTLTEEDIEGSTVIDISINTQVFTYFMEAASKLYNMKFNDTPTGIMMFNIILENLSHWLDDNAKEGEVQTLTCANALTASCEVKDGIVVKALVPDGDMKILIKNDDMYQSKDEE